MPGRSKTSSAQDGRRPRAAAVGVRPSPAARRTVELLGFLAAHPGLSFTVSELARALAQNRATCQALLLALEAADWVRRDPRKAWGLGPGLVAVGDAAQSSLHGLDALRAGVVQLEERLGLEALATVATGGQIVVVAHARGPNAFASAMRVGQTIPFVPPLGLVFVAWSGDDAVARWLDRATTPFSRRDVTRCRRAAGLARELGYCMTLDPETRRGLGSVMARLARARGSPETLARRDRLMRALAHDEYLWVDSDPHRAPHVSQLAAPVFGPDGEVAAALSLVAAPQQISVGNSGKLADALVACARSVSARLSGR